MEIQKISDRLSSEEKETVLNYDYITKMWSVDCFVQKHFNKALKQGWKPIMKYEYDDGSAAGYRFEVPERAITFRSLEKKVLSDKQLANLMGKEEE